MEIQCNKKHLDGNTNDINRYKVHKSCIYKYFIWWCILFCQVVHSKFQDLVPKQIDEDDPDMQIPDEEAVMDTTEKTRQALEKLVSTKISAALPVRAAEKQAPAQYIR